jgi:endoglucanase
MSLLKKLFCAAAAIALLPFTGLATEPAPVNPSGFVIHRGVNLSHWLSQDFRWQPRDEWITENDIRYIHTLGYDHVRLPIDEQELWNEDGTKNEAAFAKLKEGIGWCGKYGLRVIVDLHVLRSHHFNVQIDGANNTLWNSSEAQAKFFALWDDLSANLRNYPNDEVAYEMLNEPTAPDHEEWNRFVGEYLKRIRAVEPNRVIVIGANRWQNPQFMPFLKLPEGDRNIIISVHTYDPLLFTHRSAPWFVGPIRDFSGKVRYPGPTISRDDLDILLKTASEQQAKDIGNATDNWGPERINELFAPAIEYAAKHGLQLYCGEFGCYPPAADKQERLAYYHDFIHVLETNGIAWSNWEYKGDFGIFEWHPETHTTGAPDLDYINALMQGNPDKYRHTMK